MMEEDPTKNQLYQTCNSSPANGGGECTHANVLHAFGIRKNVELLKILGTGEIRMGS